jgi:hypothetical protein
MYTIIYKFYVYNLVLKCTYTYNIKIENEITRLPRKMYFATALKFVIDHLTLPIYYLQAH